VPVSPDVNSLLDRWSDTPTRAQSKQFESFVQTRALLAKPCRPTKNCYVCAYGSVDNIHTHAIGRYSPYGNVRRNRAVRFPRVEAKSRRHGSRLWSRDFRKRSWAQISTPFCASTASRDSTERDGFGAWTWRIARRRSMSGRLRYGKA